MNNNVVDSIIASIIFGVLSTGVGFILQALGFSAQESIIAALFALLIFMILFLAVRRYYPIYIRSLTEQLLENALKVNTNETDEARTIFKAKIIARVLREKSETEPKQNNPIIVHPNQDTCESLIQDAFRNARKVKIMTIKGEKYFSGARSLLYDLYLKKQTKNFTIEVLVLSPESGHITEELAEELGQGSAREIKGKMSIVLDSLKGLANQNKNFKVKCYDETPNFKILLFDDVAFVSVFIAPKNDHNAKMLQITREGTHLFTGLERYFDNLWKRSVSPQ
jgi:hypothetical protein